MAIESLRMEPASNGMKVCWVECEKTNNDSFSNRQYESKEMVFKDGEEKEAMEMFAKIKSQLRKEDSKEESKEGEKY